MEQLDIIQTILKSVIVNIFFYFDMREEAVFQIR